MLEGEGSDFSKTPKFGGVLEGDLESIFFPKLPKISDDLPTIREACLERLTRAKARSRSVLVRVMSVQRQRDSVLCSVAEQHDMSFQSSDVILIIVWGSSPAPPAARRGEHLNIDARCWAPAA